MVHYNHIMNRGSGTTSRKRVEGYTIVETLIFLAVSAAMFVSVMVLVSGQQQRTEFTQAVRTFEATMQDIANDVSTGFAAYPFNPGDTCKVTGGGAVVINSAPVGGQQRCIFIGRVVQFAPSGADNQTYRLSTVVGRQRVSAGGREVTSLTEATPVALTPGTGPRASVPNLSQSNSLSGSARVGRVTSRQGAVTSDIGSFGFFTTFQTYSSAGTISSGSSRVDVAPVTGTSLSQSSAAMADRIAAHAGTPTLTPLNPNGGITVCLLSNGSNQHALIRIGGTTGNLTVTSSIETGSTCP
jgi:type II secretory pathway pseudopilin PulG